MFSFLSSFDIWVHFSVVGSFNVMNVQNARSIFINCSECSVDYFSSLLRERASNLSQKLIVINAAIMVSIEIVKKKVVLVHGATKLIISKSLREFVIVKRLRSIIIHYSKLATKTKDRTGSSRSQNFSYTKKKFL